MNPPKLKKDYRLAVHQELNSHSYQRSRDFFTVSIERQGNIVFSDGQELRGGGWTQVFHMSSLYVPFPVGAESVACAVFPVAFDRSVDDEGVEWVWERLHGDDVRIGGVVENNGDYDGFTLNWLDNPDDRREVATMTTRYTAVMAVLESWGAHGFTRHARYE